MTLQALADPAASPLRGAATVDVLAYLPSPPQGVWQLGPFPLRAYALCIIVGIIVAIWWGERRWRERGGHPGAVLDVAVFAVPFGLIGGRLYHVATDWQKYFGADGDPIGALKIYEGGLGIWGAVLLGGVGAWVGCRYYRIPLPAFGDAIAPPILVAQAIGRLGNYFNQELYGRETEVPWGLQIFLRFDEAGQLNMMNGVSSGELHKVVHPAFLYEMLWSVLVVVALVLIDRRMRIGHGRLFALYVAAYSFGRFFVELVRDDEATLIAGIRINSFTAAVVFLVAIAYFLLATKGREPARLLEPGGLDPRPWPWQFGALRRSGATTENEKPASGDDVGTDDTVVSDPGVDASDSDTETSDVAPGSALVGAEGDSEMRSRTGDSALPTNDSNGADTGAAPSVDKN